MPRVLPVEREDYPGICENMLPTLTTLPLKASWRQAEAPLRTNDGMRRGFQFSPSLFGTTAFNN
jgi:hypothetical protein